MAFENAKSKLLAGATTAALAVSMMPAMAFAADPSTTAGTETEQGSADTAVYLEADDSMLVVGAPTEIHVKAKADGTFVTPTAASTQITNGSIFGIHVDKVTATAENSFALVKGTSTSNDAVSYTVTPNSGTAINIADYVDGVDITGSDWDMTKDGTDGDHLNLTTAGSIANVTKDLNTDQKFATLTWTFQAGANA